MSSTTLDTAFPRGVQSFDFVTDKYGHDLLVDVGRTGELPDFEFHRWSHRLNFHDLLLLRRGRGRLLQEDRWHPVGPGTVVSHRPGEVRRWILSSNAEGIVLFFTDDFLRSFLLDQSFLRRLSFFSPEGPRTLALQGDDAVFLEHRLEALRKVVLSPEWGRVLALQAGTYECLVWLERRFRQSGLGASTPQADPWFETFEEAVERDFRATRAVAHYARLCNVSTGHLNTRVRAVTGRSAGRFIRDRVLLEARRALLHTSASVAQIAGRCGFDDPSYFCRFFRREVGHSPGEFRRRGAR